MEVVTQSTAICHRLLAGLLQVGWGGGGWALAPSIPCHSLEHRMLPLSFLMPRGVGAAENLPKAEKGGAGWGSVSLKLCVPRASPVLPLTDKTMSMRVLLLACAEDLSCVRSRLSALPGEPHGILTESPAG